MSLELNLAWGEEAVFYVKMALPKGADNKVEDRYRSGGSIDRPGRICRAKTRRAMRQGVDTTTASTRFALRYGVGRCGDRSRMAFTFLREESPATDLALVYFEQWDHEVAVLGATHLLGVNYTTVSLGAEPRFGPEAVVCDPWLGLAYPLSRWTDYASATVEQTLWGKKEPPEIARAIVVDYHR